ncbi:hypothetical protein J6R97_06550 [bacterium]|nr:hypothetical protein [bacterium]
MKINNISQTNFKGFNNIVSHSIEGNYDDKIAFMTMQLNNKGPHKDLRIWRYFQRELFEQSPQDYIILSSVQKYRKSKVFIGGKIINVDELIAKKDKKFVKNFLIFLSSLTKRVNNSPVHKEDRNIYNTHALFLNHLNNVTKNENIVDKIFNSAATKKVKHNVTASILNRHINDLLVHNFRL